MPWQPKLCPWPRLESLITVFPDLWILGKETEKGLKGKGQNGKKEKREVGKEIKKDRGI